MSRDYNQVQGRIFDIQRYSIHDGPGIRTIVFLKGCYLRCRWCCNPESQSHDFEQMTMGGVTKSVGQDITVGEVMETVLKDRPYYRRSGGGLTLSGGECLFQADFTAALLEAAHDAQLNTAVESTAFAPFEKIEKILPELDYYLLDIKHMNSAKHKTYTGVPNERILENARRIAESGQCQLIIRVPVVPGFNDSIHDIQEISQFASSLPGVHRMHLLPYHRLGMDKYAGLGRDFSLADVVPPTPAHMQELLAAALRSGLECQIGG